MEAGQDIHLIDRWDPTRVMEIMLTADVGAGTGASVFLASIIDHPAFTPEHARRMRRVGLGGAPVPLALAERAAAAGIAIIRAYGPPSTRRSRAARSTIRPPGATGPTERPSPGSRCAWSMTRVLRCPSASHRPGVGWNLT